MCGASRLWSQAVNSQPQTEPLPPSASSQASHTLCLQPLTQLTQPSLLPWEISQLFFKALLNSKSPILYRFQCVEEGASAGFLKQPLPMCAWPLLICALVIIAYVIESRKCTLINGCLYSVLALLDLSFFLNRCLYKCHLCNNFIFTLFFSQGHYFFSAKLISSLNFSINNTGSLL